MNDFENLLETNQSIYDLCVKFCDLFGQTVKVYVPRTSESTLRIEVLDQLSLVVHFDIEPHSSGSGFTVTKPHGLVIIAQHCVDSCSSRTTYKFVTGFHFDTTTHSVDDVLRDMLRKCIERDPNCGITAHGKVAETIKNFLGAN